MNRTTKKFIFFYLFFLPDTCFYLLGILFLLEYLLFCLFGPKYKRTKQRIYIICRQIVCW